LDQCAVWAFEKLVGRAHLIGSVNADDYLLPTDWARHTRSSDRLHGARGFDPRNHQTSWEWEWNKFRKAAGISHRRFHDLRHTYITRAAEAGVPDAVLQAQVGHVTKEMLRWYTHISSRAQHLAARRIEAENPQLLRALGISTVQPAVVQGASTNRQQTDRVHAALFNSAGSQRRVIRGSCRSWSPRMKAVAAQE